MYCTLPLERYRRLFPYTLLSSSPILCLLPILPSLPLDCNILIHLTNVIWQIHKNISVNAKVFERIINNKGERITYKNRIIYKNKDVEHHLCPILQKRARLNTFAHTSCATCFFLSRANLITLINKLNMVYSLDVSYTTLIKDTNKHQINDYWY